MATKKQTHQTLIQVREKTYITPNYVRIVFNCNDVEQYARTTLGANNKLFLPNPNQNEIELPLFDTEKRAWVVKDETKRPSVRTYTHRNIDLVNKTLTIDFAMHGIDTVACHWVNKAQPGDEIGITMGTEPQEIVPTGLEHYIFITDPTGLPVTDSVLRSLPETANAYIIAEVPSKEDEIELISPAKLHITWLHNPKPDEQSFLEQELRQQSHLAQITSSRFAHITAEHSAVRSSRNYLRKENNWTRDDCYACAYWQIGKTENQLGKKRIDD